MSEKKEEEEQQQQENTIQQEEGQEQQQQQEEEEEQLTEEQQQSVNQMNALMQQVQQQLQDNGQNEDGEEWEEEDDEDLEEEEESSQQQQSQQEEESKEQEQQKKEVKYGCKHYERKCQIQSPCCKKWFGCRLCHDDEFTGYKGTCQEERMNRQAINLIKCLICEEEQTPSQTCKSCTVEFSRIYCDICHLWQDKAGVQTHHCDKCDMCRIGSADSLYHCDVCNVCLPSMQKGNHVCVKNIDDHNCPVCMENLKHSTKPFQSLNNCGHSIHVACLQGFLKHSEQKKCPLCNRALMNMPKSQIKQLDDMIEQLSKELKNFPKEFLEEDGKSFKKVNIVCNECSKKSNNVSLNPIGLKCLNESCGSYQTDMI